MNKYLPGQSLYAIVNDSGTIKFKACSVDSVYESGGSYDYVVVLEDLTTAIYTESELYDSIAIAQKSFSSVAVPSLPRIKVGQEVYLVRNKNVRVDIDGISLENGKVVACVNPNGDESTQYAIKLENPSGFYRGLDQNLELIWVNETQFNTEDGGATGTNFFISYNQAAEWFQTLISMELDWNLIWSFDNGGTPLGGTVGISAGNTEVTVSLGSVTGSTVLFSLQAIDKSAEITGVSFVTGALWADADVVVPTSAAPGETTEIGSAGLEPTGGLTDTASVIFKTLFNTLTLNFEYSKA